MLIVRLKVQKNAGTKYHFQSRDKTENKDRISENGQRKQQQSKFLLAKKIMVYCCSSSTNLCVCIIVSIVV